MEYFGISFNIVLIGLRGQHYAYPDRGTVFTLSAVFCIFKMYHYRYDILYVIKNIHDA
ncbi:hypothetical protein ApDm4_0241 [Acetobacter pomorum]|nr:hypothetical protein ApDm4_0241 [Acetobacter pomorum]